MGRMSRRAWSVMGLLLVLLGGAIALPTVAESTRPVVVSTGLGESAKVNPDESARAVIDAAKRQNGAAHGGAAGTGDADMSAGRDDRVELLRRSWASIVDWLETHAPATAAALLGPADEAALAEAQEATGRAWPEQLVAWLRMNDGGGRSSDSEVLPLGFLPVGVDWIVRNWRMMVDISDEVWGPEEVAAAEAQPAGSMSGPFLRSWLPFGDDTGGDLLFVDLRSGTQSGCVAGFEHDNGGFNRPAVWPDIAAMLEDVAAALQTGRWVHPNDPEFDQVPVVENRKLHWELGPSSQRKLAETRRRMEEQRRADD